MLRVWWYRKCSEETGAREPSQEVHCRLVTSNTARPVVSKCVVM